VQKGKRIIIDCDFEEQMTDRECNSLGTQLAYCHNSNKKAKKPLGLQITGIKGRIETYLFKKTQAQ